MKADYVHKDSLTSNDFEFSFKMSDEEIKKLMNLLTQGGLRHFVLKLDDEKLDVVEYKEYKKLEERIAYLERSIERKEETIDNKYDDYITVINENAELKKQLKGTTHCYDEEEHRQLKEQQQEFIKYLENCIKELEKESLNKLQNTLNLGISDITKEILQKYKEIIGVSNEY